MTSLGCVFVYLVSLLPRCPAELLNNWKHNDVDYEQNAQMYPPVHIELVVWLGFRPYPHYQVPLTPAEWPRTKSPPDLNQLNVELPLSTQPQENMPEPLVIPEFHGFPRPTPSPPKNSFVLKPSTLNQAVHHVTTRKPMPWRPIRRTTPRIFYGTVPQWSGPGQAFHRNPWRAKSTRSSRRNPKPKSPKSPERIVSAKPAVLWQRINRTGIFKTAPPRPGRPVPNSNRPRRPKKVGKKNRPHGTSPLQPGQQAAVKKAPTDLVLELAVICDKECHDSFMPFFHSEEKLKEAIFAVINQVQQYFRPPWVAEPINIFITHLEIHKRHDTSLLKSRDALILLHNFSDYQMAINPPEGQVGHWDMALLLSGKSLYITEKGAKEEKSGVLGKAWVGGFCSHNFSTVVVEFGKEGRVVPTLTAGIQASNVVAHEMAHNLGLFHDGPPKNDPCSGDHFIMAEWRSRDTTNKWSQCSKSKLNAFRDHERADCLAPLTEEQLAAARHLNAWKEQPPPGQLIDADEQCQIFLKDHMAKRAGKPEELNWCRGSQCEPIPKKYLHVVPGGWSEWQVEGECTRACLEDSVPLIRMRRFCNNPPRKNSVEGCEGDSTVLRPCDISENKNAPACTKPLTNKEYINQKCEYFSRLKPDLKPDGIQLPYNRNQTWRACSIYCRYRDSGYMFAQFDLADYPNVSSYLPDGTRCNFDNDTGAAYYCQGNQCATLLQSLAGIQDNEEGEALDVDADDWAGEQAQGRSLVEKYLKYKPGSHFAVLDKKKIKHTPLRVHVDDAVEIPGT